MPIKSYQPPEDSNPNTLLKNRKDGQKQLTGSESLENKLRTQQSSKDLQKANHTYQNVSKSVDKQQTNSGQGALVSTAKDTKPRDSSEGTGNITSHFGNPVREKRLSQNQAQ